MSNQEDRGRAIVPGLQDDGEVRRRGMRWNLALKPEDIPGIWARLVAGESLSRIGKDYGVHRQAIREIRAGRNWNGITRHLPGWPLESPEPDDREPIYIPAEFCGVDEIWRELPGYPAFRVSNYGRIQGRLEIVKGGRRGETRLGEWTDRAVSSVAGGYLVIRVSNGGASTRRTMLVHVAVLTAFACPRPPRMQGCHFDDNPLNNHASNLRWDTPKGNAADKLRRQGR